MWAVLSNEIFEFLYCLCDSNCGDGATPDSESCIMHHVSWPTVHVGDVTTNVLINPKPKTGLNCHDLRMVDGEVTGVWRVCIFPFGLQNSYYLRISMGNRETHLFMPLNTSLSKHMDRLLRIGLVNIKQQIIHCSFQLPRHGSLYLMAEIIQETSRSSKQRCARCSF